MAAANAKIFWRKLSALNHHQTAIEVTAERALLDQLDGTCETPIGASAHYQDGMVKLTAQLLSLDGGAVFTAADHAHEDDAEELGRRLADQLLADAGAGRSLGRPNTEGFMQDQIVITTRPIDDAQQDIADLKQMTITALAAPMLAIEPLTHHAKPEQAVDAIVFTSRHAPVLVDASLHHLPCYCVGGSTAIAAQRCRVSKCHHWRGDGMALVALIRDTSATTPISLS